MTISASSSGLGGDTRALAAGGKLSSPATTRFGLGIVDGAANDMVNAIESENKETTK